MNKKNLILAIVISLVAVVVVVIGYSALKDYFKTVHVQEVAFTIDDDHQKYIKEDESYSGFSLRFCVDDITSYQLTWTITPENAENKEVTFASSNSGFTVSETGLVSFPSSHGSTEITITTKDQEKTDKIKIETYTNKAANASYSFDDNTFMNSEEYMFEDDVLYLFNGQNYEFVLDKNVKFEKENTTDSMYTLTNDLTDEANVAKLSPTSCGEFVLVADKDGAKKNINVKIVEKVTGIILSNNKLNENYEIGSKNTYKLPISISTISGATNAELNYELLDSENNAATQATFNMLDADFSKLQDGVYTLKVSAKFGNYSVSFKFKLNDGYNVSTHADMVKYYNDNTVTKINLVSNYVIELTESDVDPVSSLPYLVQREGKTYLNENKNVKFIYYRTDAITVIGNGHEINAYKVPHQYINYELGHDRCILFGCGDHTKEEEAYYSPAMSSTNSSKTIKELLENGQTLNDADKATQKAYVISLYDTAPKFVFSNLKINGNLEASDYTKTMLNGSEGYMGVATLNCFGCNSADVTLDNVHVQNFLMGIMQSKYGNDSFALTVKNSTIEHVFGYAIFTNGTAKFTVQDSTLRDCGHFCIYTKSINSGKYIDHYTEIDTTSADEADFRAKLVGNVVFDNWIETQDVTPFVRTAGDNLIFSGIVNIVNTTMGNMASNVIKTENSKTYVNFAINNEAITSGVPKTEFDFTSINNYNTGFQKESYWTAFQAVYARRLTQEQAYATIIEPHSYVNDKIVCASANAKTMMNQGADALSYFYVGVNE